MRAAVFAAVVAAWLCVASAKSELEHSVQRPIAIAQVDPQASCVSNETHCTCLPTQHRRLVKIPDTNPQMCYLDPMEFESHKCACPGNALCEKLEFACEKLEAFGEFNAEGHVPCTEVRDPTCYGAGNPEPCSAHVNVFVDGVLKGCVDNIPVDSNVDDAYGYGDYKAQNIENVELDYINLRFIETTQNSELHFCVIYGNWKLGEVLHPNGAFDRHEKAKITADFPLHIEIKDDASDFYAGDGTNEVLTEHTHYASKSDGYCLGPLLGDGSGVRAEFYDLNNIFGLNVQTYDSDTTSIVNLANWAFADHRPATDLQADGHSNGDESVIVEFRPTCTCG
eukprot:CAMPEP_0185856690 /NCGR_PEP_ID=MMETSP1354-20130828/29128_1 /TAXON_ID=708628 /ORGANISM="Erythrolobus madagascarensis, Strain CCMP3276" /LENGTH=337 /DNA_ID=CAMNT_0028558951 /DNA_START=58 /DNA_END=1071 /DNA_ORIENTATION=-